MSRRGLLQGASAGAGALALSSLKPGRAAPRRAAPAVQDGDITLTLMYDKIEFSDEELKVFTDANPTIKVERLEPDETKFRAMVAAGAPPDVFSTDAAAIPSLVNRNVVLDVTPYVEASTVVNPDNLAPANRYYRYDREAVGQGSYWGLCKDWSPDFSLWANQAAFEDAGEPLPDTTTPLNYRDLLPLAERLTKRRGDRIQRVGISFPTWAHELLVQFRLMEDGQRLYAPDYSRIMLSENPPAVEALRFLYDLAEQKLTWSPRTPSPNGWDGKDFSVGLVGVIQNGFWFSGFLGSQEDAVVDDQVLMLPSPTWGSQRYNPSGAPAGSAIAQASKHPDAAWKLFEFYHGGLPAENRARAGWGVPALTSLYDLMPRETPFQQAVQEQLQAELPFSDVAYEVNPYYNRNVFADSWEKHLDQALRGDITFEQLVANLETDVNGAIADGLAALGR